MPTKAHCHASIAVIVGFQTPMAKLKDIADHAEVSIRTVSRVLKNNGYVSDQARQAVLETIDRLGYMPNRHARSLRENKSYEITVLAWSHDESQMEKARALEVYARKADYYTSILFDPMQTPEDIEEVMKEVRTRRSAGVALFHRPPLDATLWIEALQAEEIPAIFIDSEDPRVHGPRVDRERGFCDSVLYLASTGRRRIAYVGPVQDLSGKGSHARWRGYSRALEMLRREPIVIEKHPSLDKWDFGHEAGREFIELSPLPDAVQMYSDETAMAFMACLHERGLKIPDEVAVMGFNDGAMSRMAYPPLSTLKQPNEEVGKAAASLLLRKINGQEAPDEGWSPLIAPKLVIRQSA